MHKKLKTSSFNLNYLVNRLVKGKGNIEEITDKRIELAPAIKSFIQPSYYLESEFENILRYHPETTQQMEMLRIKGGSVVHEPSICWQLKDVFVAENAIYKKNFKKVFPDCVSSDESQSYIDRHNGELALPSSYQGVKYFGHWLRDDVVTYTAAKQFGEPISIATPTWVDKEVYSNIFEQNWNRHAYGKIKKLTIFQDYAQNQYRVERYNQLRSLIKAKYNGRKNSGYIYLKRGLTGANVRNLINEDKLIDSLLKQNFTILDITKHSLNYILENLMEANLVITLEGSHQNHILYTLCEMGNLIILQPPSLFNNSAKDWCNALGFKHGITICKQHKEGFEVNIESVMRLIEMMRV